jgi:predicted acetyltransferase
MPKLLISAFDEEGLTYVRRSRQLGLSIRVLDCFDTYHHRMIQWFGNDVLHVQGRRSDVTAAVAQEDFDVAIIQEDKDFVRTALITQSLREAGVGTIIAVTNDPMKRTLYRKFGAHYVIVANNVEQAWQRLSGYLPSFATA